MFSGGCDPWLENCYFRGTVWVSGQGRPIWEGVSLSGELLALHLSCSGRLRPCALCEPTPGCVPGLHDGTSAQNTATTVDPGSRACYLQENFLNSFLFLWRQGLTQLPRKALNFQCLLQAQEVGISDLCYHQHHSKLLKVYSIVLCD